ncbi:hypothetical protein D3C73_1032700 [compost metagenome]
MALGLLLLYGLFTVGLPFLLAGVVAILLEPVMLLLMRVGGMNRFVAGTLLSTLFTLMMMGFIYFLGFNIITEVILLGRTAPNYMNDVHIYVDQAIERTQLFYDSLSPSMAEQVQLWLERGTSSLTVFVKDALTGISGLFLNMAGKIPNLLILSIVFIIALFLCTFSLPLLRSSFLSLFDAKSQQKMSNVLTDLRLAVIGYMRAQMIMAALTYLVTFIGLLVLGAPYPLAISLLVMMMEFVPVVGTGLVFIPWSGFQLLAGNSSFGMGILILFLILTLLRRIIEPKILSDAVGINALAALISLYVGFELMGVTGLFFGPMVVIVYQVMRKAGLLQMNIKLD